ncbi:MAG: CNNM domain-containing protein [Mariniblastus sp.]
MQLLPWLITMAVLMACSGFFSASEAALFYLQPRDRREMKNGSPAEKAAAVLLNDPDRLLSAVLFWNLVINIVYFAISSKCAIQLEQDETMGQTAAVTFAIVSLLAIIFLSEMMPKSIAVLKPRSLSTLVSLPLLGAVRVVDPLMPLLRSVNLISRRLIWPGFKPEPFMEVSDLERAIEHSGTDAALIKQEQAVLQNIVQLSTIRIEEWMRPRTQFVSFRPPVKLSDLNGTVPASGYLLVTESESEEIEKAIRLDNQYHLEENNLERFAEPVLYLPWCATVADALEKMSHRDHEVTVVVNEFGDTIGILTIEDILETVFVYSPSRSERLLDMPPIEKIGDNKWQVVGIMSLRQLAKRLEVGIPETVSVTVGGVIQESVQRLAETGDKCQWGPFEFYVAEASQRGTMLIEVQIVEPDKDES